MVKTKAPPNIAQAGYDPVKKVLPETSQEALFALSNDDISTLLEQVADLLEIKEEDYYRIRAYREAAQTIRLQNRTIAEILRVEGRPGLEKLAHVGQRLARSLEELLQTGELRLLNQLLADVSPEDLFTTLPGIGKVLAHRLYHELDITTLEDLEAAAHMGRLDTLEGFGKGRIRLIRDELETILNRSSRQRCQRRRWRDSHAHEIKVPHPPEALLLEIDQQYRDLAAVGLLPLATPRRFNPEGKRWLPVMHLSRGGWQFSVLYSNTARAHELGKTHDWVIIYYAQAHRQSQCTIVTETRGPQRGKRVVRG